MEAIQKVSGKKILVVDDNEDNRELVIKVLRHQGCRVIDACDGREAVDRALAERPDLILMDLSLPTLDGFEATRLIKDNDDFKGIPIIALTAHAMKGDEEKALKGGFDGYIAKPIDVRKFPGQLAAYLP